MTMALPLLEPQDRSVLHCTQTAQADQTNPCPLPPPLCDSRPPLLDAPIMCLRQVCGGSTVHHAPKSLYTTCTFALHVNAMRHMLSFCLQLQMLELFVCMVFTLLLNLIAGACYCPWQQQQWYQDWLILSRGRSWKQFQIHSCLLGCLHGVNTLMQVGFC